MCDQFAKPITLHASRFTSNPAKSKSPYLFFANWDRDWSRHHPLRQFTKKQKEAFGLQESNENTSFSCAILRQSALKSELINNRLLSTVCEKPRIIFTAHFDTPPSCPSGFRPSFTLFGHTRQITGMIFLLLLLYLPGIAACRAPGPFLA
jgi:hypothetical protein